MKDGSVYNLIHEVFTGSAALQATSEGLGPVWSTAGVASFLAHLLLGPSSPQHKIDTDEAQRLQAQGVPIYRSATGPTYMGTQDGTRWLCMSRAFGDFVYPAICCEPHVCSLDITNSHLLIIASDGLSESE